MSSIPNFQPDRDLPLDGLRGICAFLVFYAHICAPTAALDPVWAPPAQFWWFNLGYAAVMIFFVLSGYVIGLTASGPATLPVIRRYLGRRALRLLPISTAAVLLAWLLRPATDGGTVLANLLYLQNSEPYPGGFYFGLLPNNPNLWSLNYEAVYYLAFLAIWRWTPPTGLVFCGLLVLTFTTAAGLPVAKVFSHYACGGLYWFAGLAIARHTAPAEHSTSRGNWPSALLGAYAIWTLAPLRSLVMAQEWHSLLGLTPASIHRLDFLPACVWCLLAVSGRAPALQKYLGLFTLSCASAGLIADVLGNSLTSAGLVGALALIAAWLLVNSQATTSVLSRLAPLGRVSFGIYAIALPIQFGQLGLWPEFAGSALTFLARAILVTVLTVGVAWILECKVSPGLRRHFSCPRQTGGPSLA